VELSARERAAAGIPENLVRYSVGIEDPADLIADLKQALDSISSRNCCLLFHRKGAELAEGIILISFR
jgi:hypothetical protein